MRPKRTREVSIEIGTRLQSFHKEYENLLNRFRNEPMTTMLKDSVHHALYDLFMQFEVADYLQYKIEFTKYSIEIIPIRKIDQYILTGLMCTCKDV